MISPMSRISDVRLSYNKQQEKTIKEVLVQFQNEAPSWIPYETLLAIEEQMNDWRHYLQLRSK